MIKKEKWDEIYSRMEKVGMKDEEIVEKFIIGSGRGGQNLHKTSSCVYLKHVPSGLEVKCQKTRSQEQNRFFARRDLLEKLEEKVLGEKSRKQQEMEKIRRQKQRKTRRQKVKMIEDKKARSTIKKGRSPSSSENQ